jgi:hypothetical protein
MLLFFAQQAKNMGRLAATIAVAGLLLCGALLGLMFAANEASKEGHVDGSVSVDLTGSPVQSKPLQSFGSLLDFPKMDATLLNELDFVSFSVQDGTDTVDMRFRVSAWTRSQSTELTKLVTQDGAKITIQGDGSGASLLLEGQNYAISVPSSQRRNLLGAKSGSRYVLYSSMEAMEEGTTMADTPRRLSFGGALMTSGKRRLGFHGALMASGKGFVVPP